MFKKIFRLKKKVVIPKWLASYEKQVFDIPSNTSLDEMTFCALDCETTGFEKTSKVISVGAVKIQKNSVKIKDAIHFYFSIPKGKKQSEIHGELTNTSFNNKEQFLKLLEYLENTVIVGHHIAFDISKLTQTGREYHHDFSLKNESVDTLLVMRQIDPIRFEWDLGDSQSKSLDALCREFNIEIENRHTALGDAYLAAQLFVRELQLLKKQKVTTIGGLRKAAKFRLF